MDNMGWGEEEGLSRLLCKEVEVDMDTRITVSDLYIFFFFYLLFKFAHCMGVFFFHMEFPTGK